jgi:hypothetical protein
MRWTRWFHGFGLRSEGILTVNPGLGLAPLALLALISCVFSVALGELAGSLPDPARTELNQKTA